MIAHVIDILDILRFAEYIRIIIKHEINMQLLINDYD